MSKLFENLLKHRKRTAFIDKNISLSYESLLSSSMKLSSQIEKKVTVKNPKILFQLQRDTSYPITQLAIWAQKGTSIPICHSTPQKELEYFIQTSQADLIITHNDNQILKDICTKQNTPLLILNQSDLISQISLDSLDLSSLTHFQMEDPALVLFTSGTTGKPKGVIHSHSTIQHQLDSLSQAWEWSENDHIFQILPLNHIHGIQCILNSSLYNGATCELFPKFDARQIWQQLLRENNAPTMFMAVPAIYQSLIFYHNKKHLEKKEEVKEKLQRLRLMVSGSSPLPKTSFSTWQDISGHRLLERFGMTEIGMGIGNPYRGDRIPGSVGFPMPGVQAELLHEQNFITEPDTPGELVIKGKNVFKGYFNNSKATQESFHQEWFRTGDMGYRTKEGRFVLMGRISQDILKKHGFKVSALEVENSIRELGGVTDIAIVQDGEEVAGCIVLEGGKGLDQLRKECVEVMSGHKIPGKWMVVEELPRNAMGKVDKKEVKRWFQEEKV